MTTQTDIAQQRKPTTLHGLSSTQFKAVDYAAFRKHMNCQESTVVAVARGTTLAIGRQHQICALIKSAYFDSAGHCQAARYFIVDGNSSAPLPLRWRLRITAQALRLRLDQQWDKVRGSVAQQRRLRSKVIPAMQQKKSTPVWTTLRLTT